MALNAANVKITLIPDGSKFHADAANDLKGLSASVKLTPDLDGFKAAVAAEPLAGKVKLKVDEAHFRQQLDTLPGAQVRADLDTAKLRADIEALPALPLRATLDVDTAAAVTKVELLPELTMRARLDVDTAGAVTKLAAIEAPTWTAKVKVDRSQVRDAISSWLSAAPAVKVKGKFERSQLRQALADVNLPVVKLKSTVEIDKAAIRTDLAGLTNLKVPVAAKIDRTQIQQQLTAMAAPELTARVKVDAAQVRTALAGHSPTLKARLEVDTSWAMVSLRQAHNVMQMWLWAHPLVVRIQTDNSSLNALLNALHGVNDAASGAGRSMGRLGPGRISLIVAAVVGLASALGAATGAVGGLAMGLAGLGAVGLPVIGALAVGLSGVGKALSAFGQEASGGGAAVADASDQIASAEYSVQQALRQSRSAQEDLTRARKDAKREIEDLNASLRQNGLDERENALAVADARDELAKTNADEKSTVRDREKAQLRLDQALARQEEGAVRGKRLAEDTADANRRGVEGSAQVVAAKQAIADADHQVAEAQRALAKAMQGTAAAAGGKDPVAEALAKLSPNAREWVLAVRSMGDAWNDVKMSTQDALFAGAADGIKALGATYLPVLKTGLTGVATEVNGVAHGLSDMLLQGNNVSNMEAIFAGAAGFVAGMKTGILQMTQGLLDFGAAAAPVGQQLGEGFGAIFGEIGKALSELSNSGAITQLMGSFAALMKDGIGPLLGDLVRTLVTVGNAVVPALTPFLATLGDALVTMGPALGELGAAFLTAMTPLLPIVSQLVVALSEALVPMLPSLSQIVGLLGTVLADAMVQLAPILPAVSEAFLQILQAFVPMVEPLTQIASVLLPPLIDALGWLAPALPVIVGAFVAWKVATAAMAIAQGALNLVMAVSPLGWIVIAITAVVAAVVLMWNKFDWFRNGVKAVWETLKVAFKIGVDYVSEKLDQAKATITEVSNWVTEKFDAIKRGFSTLGDAASGIWDGMKEGAKTAFNSVASLWNSTIGSLEIDIPDWVPGIGGKTFAVKKIALMADGGLVRGPGGPRDDMIDARLSNGEFVMRAASVAQYGGPAMAAVNAGTAQIAYASGGPVGAPAGPRPVAASSSGADPMAPVVALLTQIAASTGQTAAVAVTSGGAGAPGAPAAAAAVPAAAAAGGDPAAAAGETGAAVAGLGTAVAGSAALMAPALAGVQAQLTGLATTAVSQLTTIAAPAVTGLGTVVAAAQAGQVSPALSAMTSAVRSTSSAMLSATTGQMVPAWSSAGSSIRSTQAGPIDTAFRETRSALSHTAATFGPAAQTIGTQWSQVREGTAAPVRYTIRSVFNDGLVGMWNSVSELIGTKTMSTYPVRFADGGAVRGPGGPRDDKIPALLSNREFVAPVSMVEAIGGGSWSRGASTLESVRRASLGPSSDMPSGPEGMFGAVSARFADGGIVMGSPAWKAIKRGHDFAKSQSGKGYQWAGPRFRGDSFDCSGYMASIAASIIGDDPWQRYWFTGTFGRAQKQSGPQGFVKGLGAGFSIGVTDDPGGPGGGHTAGTLGGVIGLPTVNVESGGQHNSVRYGGPAAGADHSQFLTQYHLPVINGEMVRGGFKSGGGGGSYVDPGQMVADAMKPHADKVNAALAGYSGRGMIGELPRKTWDTMHGAAKKTIDKKIEELLASGGMGPLGAGSEFYVKEIIAAAKARALGPMGAAIGVATAIVETGLRMYANNAVPESLKFPHDAVGSDHDSVGLFQQRQAGWGTIEQRMNARGSAGLFFDKLMTFDWRSMDPGAAAQRVQVSAFPDRYGQAMPQARGLVAKHGYDQGGWLETGVSTVYNGFRKPEAILSPAESEAFVGIADRFIADERAGATYVGQQVQTQYVVDPDEVNASTRRQVRRAIAQEVALV